MCDACDGIREAVAFTGSFIFNIEVPDGTPRMLTDVSKISTLGWCTSTALRPGIASVYCSLVDNVARRDVNCASAPVRAFS